MSLSIYHGNEEWILKGVAVDIEASFNKLYPEFPVQRIESFTNIISKSEYHLFVQQGQLQAFVIKNGPTLLQRTICIFTHFDISQFPVDILNQCHSVIFMSSSQLSVAVANGLDPSRSYVVPIGVNQQLHCPLDRTKLFQIPSIQKTFAPMNGRRAVGFCLRYWDKPAYVRRKRYKLVMSVVKILAVELGIPVIVLGPGWKECQFKVVHDNIYYVEAQYKYYPYLYNLMSVYVSLSAHEGGPMPLLESLSCGIRPVVTNTGFAFDILSDEKRYQLLSVAAPIHGIVSAILNAYDATLDVHRNRMLASSFTFDCAAHKLMKLIN